MNLFTEKELKAMRGTQASSMNDTCSILRYTTTPEPDEYGQVHALYDEGPPLACGFRQLSAQVVKLPDHTPHMRTARLRLPLDLDMTVTKHDRIKILKRDQKEIEPVIYAVSGRPKRGRTAFFIKLKDVDL